MKEYNRYKKIEKRIDLLRGRIDSLQDRQNNLLDRVVIQGIISELKSLRGKKIEVKYDKEYVEVSFNFWQGNNNFVNIDWPKNPNLFVKYDYVTEDILLCGSVKDIRTLLKSYNIKIELDKNTMDSARQSIQFLTNLSILTG